MNMDLYYFKFYMLVKIDADSEIHGLISYREEFLVLYVTKNRC